MSTLFTAGTRLTETLESTLKHPASSPEFDLLTNTNEVLSDVGLTAADSGGHLSFYGQDPIIASPHRFGAMAAIGLATKSVAAARARPGPDTHRANWDLRPRWPRGATRRCAYEWR